MLFINFQEDLLHVRLSKLSVDNLLSLLKEIDELQPSMEKLSQALKLNAISGRVLMHCDLAELKSILGLSFGHWEIFRLLINCLREIEKLQPNIKSTEVDTIQPSFQRQKSVVEKQVIFFTPQFNAIKIRSFHCICTNKIHTIALFHLIGKAAKDS